VGRPEAAEGSAIIRPLTRAGPVGHFSLKESAGSSCSRGGGRPPLGSAPLSAARPRRAARADAGTRRCCGVCPWT